MIKLLAGFMRTMRNFRKDIIIFILLAGLGFGCGKKETEENGGSSGVPVYSAEIGNATDSAGAMIIKDNLSLHTKDSVYLFDAGKTISVRIGKFLSPFDAGYAAFNLLMDSVITGYKIFRGKEEVNDTYSEVVVVGKYLNDRPALYSFDLKTKKYKLLWSKWGKKIVSFINTPDASGAYFITVLSIVGKGTFPSVRDARLFFLDREDNSVRQLEKFGKGAQIFSDLKRDSIFEFSFSNIDTVSPSIINQRIVKYDLRGEKLGERASKFDLFTDGFPLPPPTLLKLKSPADNNGVEFGDLEGSTGIFIRDKDGRRHYITTTDDSVKYFDWTRDGNFLFIITEPSDTVGMGEGQLINAVFIINATEKKLVNVFVGEWITYFALHGRFLLFDEGFDENATIIFYDYLNNTIYHKLKIPGGCGVKNIPSKSGY